MHHTQYGCETFVAGGAQPSCRQRFRRFQMHAQDLDEHELRQVLESEAPAGKFSVALTGHLLNEPYENRCTRRRGAHVNQRREHIG